MTITKFFFKDKESQEFAAKMLEQLGLVNTSKEWYENSREGYVETLTVTLFEL